MAQVSMTVRMDAGIKARFEELCQQFGMSVNTAMNVFARAVVQRGKIPFEIRGDKAENAASSDAISAFRTMRMLAEAGMLPELTDADIDMEIRKSRRGQ